MWLWVSCPAQQDLGVLTPSMWSQKRSESGLDLTLAPVLCDVGEGLPSELSFHINTT